MPPAVPSSSSSAATPPSTRRRWRRPARILTGLLLLTAALVTGVWLGRVPLLNRLMAPGHSVWRVRVEGLDFLQDGKIRITGLKVLHADQREPVFQFASGTTGASWADLRAARLGDVVLENPAVHWRQGLRFDPPEPFTGLVPLVSWQSLKVTGGVMDLASGSRWRLKARAAGGQAGAGAYLSNGRVSVTSASLSLDDPEFAMTLTGAPVGVPAFEVKAARLTVGGALEPGDGRLSLRDAALSQARMQVISPLGEERDGRDTRDQRDQKDQRGEAGGGSFSGDFVRVVDITGFMAPALVLKAAAPWKISAGTDLSARRFLWSSGQPATAEGVQLARSSLTLADLIRIPLFRLEGNLTTRGPQLSLLKLAAAEAGNRGRLPGPEEPRPPGLTLSEKP